MSMGIRPCVWLAIQKGVPPSVAVPENDTLYKVPAEGGTEAVESAAPSA